jgi:hypothetical protein
VETGEVAIIAVAAIVIVAIVALASWRMKAAEIEGEASRSHDAEAARGDAREAREAAALHPIGPPDGAKMVVHVGLHDVQGTRVLRDAPEAQGWIVIDDAELLDGNKRIPVGGRQWLHGAQWMQEL